MLDDLQAEGQDFLVLTYGVRAYRYLPVFLNEGNVYDCGQSLAAEMLPPLKSYIPSCHRFPKGDSPRLFTPRPQGHFSCDHSQRPHEAAIPSMQGLSVTTCPCVLPGPSLTGRTASPRV